MQLWKTLCIKKKLRLSTNSIASGLFEQLLFIYFISNHKTHWWEMSEASCIHSSIFEFKHNFYLFHNSEDNICDEKQSKTTPVLYFKLLYLALYHSTIGFYRQKQRYRPRKYQHDGVKCYGIDPNWPEGTMRCWGTQALHFKGSKCLERPVAL